ncbi:MAG: 2-oxo acid dehydrogenase subunit E2 [Spirochaetaceae bacterium]
MKHRREKTSTFRKLSIYGFEMVNGGHTFYGLLEFDVTDLRRELRSERSSGAGGSMFSFMLKAIGKCLEEYPEFNSMINTKKKTTFYEVDIDVPIEVQNDGELYNKQCIIRDINNKTLKEVDEEISRAKAFTGEEKSYMASKFGQKLITVLPRPMVMFLFRQILKNHELVRKFSGTVFVTSVSMFSTTPGYIIPYTGGPKAVSLAVGSVSKKPVVKKNKVQIREIINITAAFNHDLVDGAPAARFINRLRHYIEQDYRSLL